MTFPENFGVLAQFSLNRTTWMILSSSHGVRLSVSLSVPFPCNFLAWTESAFWYGLVVSRRALKTGCAQTAPPFAWTESAFSRGPSPLFGVDRWSRVEP